VLNKEAWRCMEGDWVIKTCGHGLQDVAAVLDGPSWESHRLVYTELFLSPVVFLEDHEFYLLPLLSVGQNGGSWRRAMQFFECVSALFKCTR